MLQSRSQKAAECKDVPVSILVTYFYCSCPIFEDMSLFFFLGKLLSEVSANMLLIIKNVAWWLQLIVCMTDNPSQRALTVMCSIAFLREQILFLQQKYMGLSKMPIYIKGALFLRMLKLWKLERHMSSDGQWESCLALFLFGIGMFQQLFQCIPYKNVLCITSLSDVIKTEFFRPLELQSTCQASRTSLPYL